METMARLRAGSRMIQDTVNAYSSSRLDVGLPTT